MVEKVIIVGAGPAGILLAHYLLRRGRYKIDIYDRRSDPRNVPFSSYRTYPLSLNERGSSALRNIEGLEAAVRAKGVEVTESVWYGQKGKAVVSPRRKPIITIDRTTLVIALLAKLTEKYDDSQVNIHFNCKLKTLDFETKTAIFESLEEEKRSNYDRLIGADGARSQVRNQFLNTELFEFEQRYQQNAYKTLFLPPPHESGHNIKQGKIHGWRTKNGISLLALPQPDETVSCIIPFPIKKNPIASLSSVEEVLKFFRQNIPEIGQSLPETEAEAFLKKPVSLVMTVRCNRYHQSDRVLIIGDAAHAVSPFLGQGCNSALEDVVVFNKLLDKYSDNWAEALPQFTATRVSNAHALQELCENAFPLSKRLAVEFFLRMSFQRTMNKILPQFFSPFLFDVVGEANVSYSEIFDSNRNWIAKVKKSNEKVLNTL